MIRNLLFLIIFLAISAHAFPKQDTSSLATYTLDVKKSFVKWRGTFAAGEHVGRVKFISGEITINKDNQITSGVFIIDMNSIVCTDLETMFARELVRHLKSEDFFDVDKYPICKVEITRAAVAADDDDAIFIDSKLTLKGVANKLAFDAIVKQNKRKLVAVSDAIIIDRTKYGIKYASPSLFKNIGDEFIDDIIELSVEIVASK